MTSVNGISTADETLNLGNELKKSNLENESPYKAVNKEEAELFKEKGNKAFKGKVF